MPFELVCQNYFATDCKELNNLKNKMFRSWEYCDIALINYLRYVLLLHNHQTP